MVQNFTYSTTGPSLVNFSRTWPSPEPAQSWFQNFNYSLRTDTRLRYRLTVTVGINVDSGSWATKDYIHSKYRDIQAFLEHNSLTFTIPKTNNEQDKTMTLTKIFV
ncbi:hypothetical protein ElyMa_004090500 [Elysia marginata]|uniref:Uncharacterized protein n=1 Tax=Elysia marginata TaxID=1093978 RepID=A0AAV4GA62_9GAST|nr:hypothetical protein ElyMa_004090500 [Elysia marginata]